jgi:hypothetical protein
VEGNSYIMMGRKENRRKTSDGLKENTEIRTKLMISSFVFDVHGWAAMTKKQKEFNQDSTRKREINVQLKV